MGTCARPTTPRVVVGDECAGDKMGEDECGGGSGRGKCWYGGKVKNAKSARGRKAAGCRKL